MARRRYQFGCLYKRGKRRQMWVARWREDVIRADGTVGRVLRSEVLGPVSEIPKREALKLLEARVRQIHDGRQRPKANISFEQFVREQWERAVMPTLKPGSVRYYGIQLRCHLIPAFGIRRLAEITRADVQRFLAEKRMQGFSGSSVHGMRTALSKVLQEAVDWDYLEQNPARGIRVGDRTPKQERVYLSAEHVAQLHNSLPEPCRTLVLLAVLTGLRIGELLALRWKHVDLLHSTIRVRETVYEGRFGTPKTRSSRRDVPMSQPVREALIAQHARCALAGPDDLVFSSRAGTPISPKNMLRRVLQPACRGLGLPAITWHSFRHTHATLLGEVGESLRTAQAILGHSNLETTLNVYTHAIPESQRRAVEKVAEILFPNVPKFSGSTENRKVN